VGARSHARQVRAASLAIRSTASPAACRSRRKISGITPGGKGSIDSKAGRAWRHGRPVPAILCVAVLCRGLRLGADQPGSAAVRDPGTAIGTARVSRTMPGALGEWISPRGASQPGDRNARAMCPEGHSLSQLRSGVRLTRRPLRSKSPVTRKKRAPRRVPPTTGRQLPGSEHGKVGGGGWLARRWQCVCRATGRVLGRRPTRAWPVEKRFGWKRTEALTWVGICSGGARRSSRVVSDQMAPARRATAASQSTPGGVRRARCVRDARGSQTGSGTQPR
jgi:hypothetical protein